MTEMATEEFLILDEAHEFEIPCDYSSWWDHSDAAAWIAHCLCPDCGETGKRLICTECKDTLMRTENAVRCPGCDVVIVPARKAYATIEAL